MITTERKPATERRPLAQRRQSTDRAMAWRAAARGGVQPRIPFEAILFGALLLPLALGGCLVIALRHQAAASSPLLPLLGAAVAGAAGLIYHIDSRRRERPLQAAIRIGATVRPGAGAGLAIALALAAALLTINDQASVAAALLWVAGLAVLLANVVWLERPGCGRPRRSTRRRWWGCWRWRRCCGCRCWIACRHSCIRMRRRWPCTPGSRRRAGCPRCSRRRIGGACRGWGRRCRHR